ncbi:type I restriction-modification enzyme R subunit C-terminal domain-containing protein [Paracoccus fontiphilus]|uniref:Type I restriction-modification enzyme R subunit C-terminal domain-containing protein n=2 Tax=Paracoccus fontiphilus TaxID=1815556 RepID=A0ABV7INE8_9RHOB
MGIDVSSFVVRQSLREVQAWQSEEAPWSDLPEHAAEDLAELATLPSGTSLGSEEAKRFDLLMFELQLALLGRSTKLEASQRKLSDIVMGLSSKTDIPAVARHAELIEDILTQEWWHGLTVPIVESARLRLREIVHLIDQGSRTILYSDFEDELAAPTTVALNPAADFAAFKKKARQFMAQHEDHIALRKLRTGKPLTLLDLEELERMLLEAGVGSPSEISLAKTMEAAQVRGFGVFLRALVGLERGAVQEHFADFIADGKSADQIEFVGMVIEHLCRSGVVDPGLLYDSPFTDQAPDGPDSVFSGAEVENFLEHVRSINRTAEVPQPAEAG